LRTHTRVPTLRRNGWRGHQLPRRLA